MYGVVLCGGTKNDDDVTGSAQDIALCKEILCVTQKKVKHILYRGRRVHTTRAIYKNLRKQKTTQIIERKFVPCDAFLSPTCDPSQKGLFLEPPGAIMEIVVHIIIMLRGSQLYIKIFY
jgi:hypothetical protein